MNAGRRRALVGLGIGLALADSSVVTLALPDILRRFDVQIPQVAWVLTSYNLGLALAAVPAAYAARRRPRAAFAAGTLGVARAVAESSAFSVVGGGDTVAALHQAGVTDRIGYISTAGGAFLEFLEGRELPGVAALDPA